MLKLNIYADLRVNIIYLLILIKNFFAFAWDLLEHGDKYSSNVEWIIKNISKAKLIPMSILPMNLRVVRTTKFNGQYCKFAEYLKTTCNSAERFRQGSADFQSQNLRNILNNWA